MASDPPDAGEGEAPGSDFDALRQRAAAAAERGAARQRELETDTTSTSADATPDAPARWAPRTPVLVALVLLVFLAGGAVGWIARGGSTRDTGATPVTNTTPSLPASVTTAVAPTTSATATTLVTSTSAPPPSATTTPGTAAPSPAITPPPTPSPPPSAPPAPQMQHTVRVGESFWAIAEAEVARVTQHQPDLSQVDGYWRTLIRANADRLVHPGNPDLVYPGQVLVLPTVPGSP